MRKALLVSAVVALLAGAFGTAIAAPGNDKDKMQTASGNVARLAAADRAVVVAIADGPETRFVWTNDTKINGTLAVGARVTIRYTTLPDGQNLAHQISVTKS
jgi:N-acetylmuramic acid 6-phosphate (MurNAc-6-P) etherase